MPIQKKKKILHVCKNFYPSIGGVERYVYEIGKWQVKRGYEVHVIARKKYGNEKNYRKNGIKVHFIEKKSFFANRKMIRNLVEEIKPNVIHSHDWNIALSLLNFKNHVCTFHGPEKHFLGKLLQQYVYKKMKNRIIVVSDYLKKKFPEANLIYEGVNLKEFKPCKKKHSGYVIGYLGRIDKERNVDVIISAFKKLDVSDKKLLIAGIRDTVRIKKYCVGNIKYLGMVKKQIDFFSQIDCFVMIPKFEGFGLAWLEAMACEIPTIGNNAGIAKKLPILKAFNEEELVKRMKEAKDMKTNYRKWLVKNNFTWDKVVDNIISAYKKVEK
ncbi:MAG: glycosyltransferase family 4 protein [Candidatus Nanoarchaeia archaeon]